jgi:isocitrate/isopropylmalate dehydrogenase
MPMSSPTSGCHYWKRRCPCQQAGAALECRQSTHLQGVARPSLRSRWGKQTWANVRPARWVPGYRSPLTNPQGIDFVIVGENLEDLCLTRGQGGNASTTDFCEAVGRSL